MKLSPGCRINSRVSSSSVSRRQPLVQVMHAVDASAISNSAHGATVRFTQYADAVSAAVAGHGVVIGRLPLLAQLVRQKKLVAPFRSPAASRRGYFVTLTPHAAHNPSALAFAAWLQAQAREALPATRRT